MSDGMSLDGDRSNGVLADGCNVGIYSLASRLCLSSPLDKSLLAVSQQSSYTVNEDSGDVPFCTRDNVDECIAFLNQELSSVGLPSLYEGSCRDSFDVSRLVNSAYHLLYRLRRCVKSRDDLQDSKYRAESDMEYRLQEKRRLQVRLEQLERDLVQSQLREKQLKKINKLFEEKLKTEKEELKKLQIVVQNRDAQYRHLVRKKEAELSRLKERLHALLVDKTDSKIGLEVSDMLLRPDGKRGRWKSAGLQSDEEIYRSVISGHEEKHKELSVENHELRETLRTLQKELSTLLMQSNSSVKLVDQTSQFDDNDQQLSEGHFQLPYSLVYEDMLVDFHQKLAQLKEYIHSLENSASTLVANDSEENLCVSLELKYKQELDRLQQKLEHYESILEQNPTLHSVVRRSPTKDVNLVKEHDKLANEKRLFFEQLTAFEEKKRQLAELECRLNKEKIAIEMEKCNRSSPLNRNAALLESHRPKSAMSTPSSCPQLQRLSAKRFLPPTPNSDNRPMSEKIGVVRGRSAAADVRCSPQQQRGAVDQLDRQAVQQTTDSSLLLLTPGANNNSRLSSSSNAGSSSVLGVGSNNSLMSSHHQLRSTPALRQAAVNMTRAGLTPQRSATNN